MTLRSYLNEKVAAPVYKTEINGRGNSLRWPRNTLYSQRLALTSPTSGGHSVGIVRLRTTATEFSSFISNNNKNSYYTKIIDSFRPTSSEVPICLFTSESDVDIS
jgi:hypothetical protein